MKIIVGLGNPGKEYEKTRHNVGFMAVEELRKNFGFDEWSVQNKHQAQISEGIFNKEKIILVQPLTFMNNSGEAVHSIVDFYKVPLSDLWVIYDDIDLLFGTLRIRPSGSAGTHNGMKSIATMLVSTDFPRFRMGIESRGATAPVQEEISSFVLHAFKKDETAALATLLKKTTDSLECALKEGIKVAMDRFNG